MAERSKARGTMLVRLLAALRGVEGAKAGVEAAQVQLARAQEELAAVSGGEKGGGLRAWAGRRRGWEGRLGRCKG